MLLLSGATRILAEGAKYFTESLGVIPHGTVTPSERSSRDDSVYISQSEDLHNTNKRESHFRNVSGPCPPI